MKHINTCLFVLSCLMLVLMVISGCNGNSGGGNGGGGNGGGGNGGGGNGGGGNGGGGNSNAISCNEGNVVVPARGMESTSVIMIDGEGSACIIAREECNVMVDAGTDVILTNCSTCIVATGSASVVVSASSTITCNAFGDGIDSENSATIVLAAGKLIEIVAGSDGIESSSNSMVSLSADVCNIMSGSTPLDAEGSSVIDTSGCGQLNTQ